MELSFKKILLHLGLFVLTFITATLAGAEWVYGKSVFMPEYSWQDFASGMAYSIPFLAILTVHEFGHYFTAVYYKVKVTLPYYIPLPPFAFSLGTLGALIRLKTPVHTKQQNFDIGIAGPLAGFVLAFGILWYAFATLPPPEYVFQFHPEYKQYGLDYANFVYQADKMPQGLVDIILGKNLLFMFFEKVVADPSRVPNAHEIMHYPLLLAGFFSLVFTSLNLLPIGQLDGGHVVYGLFGFKRHRIIASVAFILFLFYSGLGVIVPGGQSEDLFFGIPYPYSIPVFVGFLYICLSGLKWNWQNQLMTALIIFVAQFCTVTLFPTIHGYSGWLLFIFLLGRVIGIPHPPSEIEEPLTSGRKVLGWVALAVFVICLTPAPVDLAIASAPTP